jgi:hypothetical protein
MDASWQSRRYSFEIHLRADESELVSIAMIAQDPRPTPVIRFTGATHGEPIMVINEVYFHLLIPYKPKPIERWFCFRNVNNILEVSNEAPPALVASLATASQPAAQPTAPLSKPQPHIGGKPGNGPKA